MIIIILGFALSIEEEEERELSLLLFSEEATVPPITPYNKGGGDAIDGFLVLTVSQVEEDDV